MEPMSTIYTTDEAATMFKVSKRTILRAIKAGKLQAKKIGRGCRMTSDALRAYWEKFSTTPGGK
jgi:excisionase family DNA binding protein